jgi:Protein of unknown function (DUF2889)
VSTLEQPDAMPGRVTNPLPRLPARRPGSVRRASSLAIEPAGGWENGVVVRAAGQDTVADLGDGTVTAVGRAVMTAAMDAASRLTAVGGDVSGALAGSLIGLAPASGFRKELSCRAEAGLDQASLLAALLDDLPTVRLISGYARLIEMPPPLPGGRTAAPVLNVCRGWAVGGTASRLAAAGESVITSTPRTPAFGELLADQTPLAAGLADEPPVRPRSMRRRRILDLVRDGDAIDVYQYFRDSHVDGGGREGSLHEYVMTARLSAGDLVVREIMVEPRALPFPECSLAAANAQLLVGTSTLDVESAVRSTLSGTMGCTHLNDVLRFLRFAGSLALAIAPGCPR